jgi:hypothetical protein
MANEKGKPSESSKLRNTARLLGKVVAAPLTMRERLNKGLLPIAYVLGILGMLALVGCGVFWALPDDKLPDALNEAGLPYLTMVSLLFASLLGWGCMQKGLGRMRRGIGFGLGGALFVGLPMACAAVLLVHAHTDVDVTDWGGGTMLLGMARWFPPCLIMLALAAYVTGKSRIKDEGRFERGFWFTLLVAPYALLMAYLVFGLDAPYLNDHLQDAIHDLGSGAIVAQIALAYFASSGGGSS